MLEGTCHCGAVHWSLDAFPKSATACNCSICRRYGVLWAYGHIGREIVVSGKTGSYRRADHGEINFHFCPTCACITYYVGVKPRQSGLYRTAVNLRLSDPEPIADLPIDHFDGFDSFKALARDGRTVRDMWF